MKQLIVIIGPNGVGKSTSAKEIVSKCKRMAYVDSDWCRVMNPFVLTEITKQTVKENIYCLIRNYFTCSEIDVVIFTHSWHGGRKEIYEQVIEKLKEEGLEFKETIIILKCSKEENIKRAIKDGRDEIRIKRGMEKTFNFYDEYEYPVIDTTHMLPSKVAEKLLEMLGLGK